MGSLGARSRAVGTSERAPNGPSLVSEGGNGLSIRLTIRPPSSPLHHERDLAKGLGAITMTFRVGVEDFAVCKDGFDVLSVGRDVSL